MSGLITRTGWHPVVIASWDAGDALTSMETSGSVASADIALDHLLEATERVRRFDPVHADALERRAGDVFLLKLLTQGQAEARVR